MPMAIEMLTATMPTESDTNDPCNMRASTLRPSSSVPNGYR